jgi:hypothetical protein
VSYELPPVLSDEKDCIYDVLHFRFRHPKGHGESDMSRFNDLCSKGRVGVRERRRKGGTRRQDGRGWGRRDGVREEVRQPGPQISNSV